MPKVKRKRKNGTSSEEDEDNKASSIDHPRSTKFSYNLDQKLNDAIFDQRLPSQLVSISGNEFTVQYCKNGKFDRPIYFEKTDGLRMRLPKKEFSVKNVRAIIGDDRILDVVDVNTQEGLRMTMKDFVKYYYTPVVKRKKLLNVLSLEYSKTEMADIIRAPAVIKDLDWVELVWPDHLVKSQTDQTNAIKFMKYPKVQNYCLMSVAGCYTDFHIDFGGTSVWYHVWRGAKVFWLAPPTDQNLMIFKHWTLSGRQNRAFLGDFLENCFKVRLRAGSTFMIPSGWIHAVYTEEDSLIFGGNFLHSFAMKMQIKIFQLESETHVPSKLRYPFFQEILWYVLEKYFCRLFGASSVKDYLGLVIVNNNVETKPRFRQSLTQHEIEGLNSIFSFLTRLPQCRIKCPLNLDHPAVFLQTFKQMLISLSSNCNEVDNKLVISRDEKLNTGCDTTHMVFKPKSEPEGNDAGEKLSDAGQLSHEPSTSEKIFNLLANMIKSQDTVSQPGSSRETFSELAGGDPCIIFKLGSYEVPNRNFSAQQELRPIIPNQRTVFNDCLSNAQNPNNEKTIVTQLNLAPHQPLNCDVQECALDLRTSSKAKYPYFPKF